MSTTATELPTLFTGEVQFRRYSDTSTQGQQIVLSLSSREELQTFIGLEGRRMMAVFVLLSDDEQPEPVPATKEKPLKEGPRRKTGPICSWLVMRCKEPAFQQWAVGVESETECAEHVRALCGVDSRSEIDGNADAEDRFESLIRKPWARHTKDAERQAVAERRQSRQVGSHAARANEQERI